jgi:hypothetical protein
MIVVTQKDGKTHSFQDAEDFKLNGSTLQVFHDDKCIAMFAANEWTFVQKGHSK